MLDLRKSSFNYHLPEENISQEAFEERDNSKLLVYNSNQQITHHLFKEIPTILKNGDTLVINNTKVFPARILLSKPTGASIEVFLLSPIKPNDITTAMQLKKTLVWKTMIRNLKKWKEGEQLYKILNVNNEQISIAFEIVDRKQCHVKLSWDYDVSFGEIINILGQMPLPPYIKRIDEPTEKDILHYQTVYAQFLGAVAAPTAGLHFTNNVFKAIASRGIHYTSITLHVGVGTFLPIREELIAKHKMHCESFLVTKDSVEEYLNCRGQIIAVGTTSVRALESLYWIGFQLYHSGFKDNNLIISQVLPYTMQEKSDGFSVQNAFEVIQEYMHKTGVETICADTEIMIAPGYKFKTIDGIVTNFHLPESTLIMLIAAWVGNDWKRIYNVAIENKYRFLSFGDSSLLFKNVI